MSCSRIVLLAMLLLALRVHAQDFNHYLPLQSMGPIPEELRIASSTKYARDVEELGEEAKGREGRMRNSFLLQSNFILDELLLSGRVIFNDPVSAYVTQVKDRVLRDHPDLQQAIRIYLVKSPSVNAFATNSGILLVNMGLLAHLNSEAELAFVLCHEIQHYLGKHPINSYVNAEQLKNNARLLRLSSMEDYMAARNRYARSLELEADARGLELYRKSGYTLAAIDRTFDMLDYADRPFEELPWDASFFEWEYLRFPATFTKQALDTVVIQEDKDDTLSTHPNVAKRRAAIAEKLAATDQDDGETFLVGAEQFLNARKRCRFELSELYLGYHAFEESIYNSYLLLQEEPGSHYLRKCIAQALYGLCVYRNARKFESVHIDADDMPGEIQQLLYFMESMDREAFTIVALHEVWKTYLSNPQDGELRVIAHDVLRLLSRKHDEAFDWLAHEMPQEYPAVLTQIQQEKQAHAAQRDSMQKAGGNSNNLPNGGDNQAEEERPRMREDYNAYLKWAVTDLFADTTFAAAWAAQAQGKIEPMGTGPEEATKKYNDRDKKARLKGHRLGIDKLVLVQPLYKNVDLRSKIPVQYLDSELSLARYKETLEEMAHRNEVTVDFLENRALAAEDVQEFNDAAIMLLWFGDYMRSEQENVPSLNFRMEETQALMQRYGTKYFGWTGLVTVTDRQEHVFGYVVMGTMLLPVLPLFILKAVLPVKKTFFVTMIFDLETSTLVMEDYRRVRAKDKRTITRATLYDMFYQIKHQPK